MAVSAWETGNMAIVRVTVALAFTLISFACASSPIVLDGWEERSSTVGLTVVDQRPEETKKHSHLSDSPKSCDYFTWRMGDDLTQPTKLVLLKRDLEDALGAQISGATITITKYEVFNNGNHVEGSPTNGPVSPMGGVAGVIVAAIMGGISGNQDTCTKENTTAWYDPSEITDTSGRRFPWVIQITAIYKGKTYDARSVVFPIDLQSVFTAMRKANLALADELRGK